MKKRTIIVIVAIIIGIIGGILLFWGIDFLFSKQYNANGVSHFLVVTYDKNQPREYLGELDGYKIYIESLNLEETNFRNVKAENVPIKKAINEKLVSVSEWRKYSWRIRKEDDMEILIFDTYEIVCANNECIIRPISR